MRPSYAKYAKILFLALCIISIMAPEMVMGARLTGADKLVTTSNDKNNVSKPRNFSESMSPKRSGEKISSAPQKAQQPGVDYVTIDFDNVDILVFIKFISEVTGKNFVVDKSVRGTVTIISPGKISVHEAYKVFESVLEVHGFAAVSSGDIIKIITARDASGKNIETRLKEEAISPEDRVVTQIISLNYANPDEMRKILTPLISKSSIILSYTPTGMLVVTDLLSNIKRLLKIIKALDIEGIEEQISVIPLRRASAQEIAKSVNLIFQKTSTGRKGTVAPSIQIVADERTNTIITSASENDTSRIKQLINLLDKEVPKGEAKVRVYRLQNADAEELTKVLMNLPSKETKTTEAGKSPILSKDIGIIPDKATNTLVITADRDDYIVLEDVIKQLDIPRPMVYIEALIMEVNVDRSFDIGAEWVGGDYLNDSEGRTKIAGGGFSGGGQYPNLTDFATNGLLPQGFSVGVLGESIQIGDVVFPNISALFTAYQRDQDVHILATPQILTLDNEEAELQVAKNVPYLTKEAAGDQNYQTFEYRDVGVTLKITPQISQERFVRLNVFEEVTKLIGDVGVTDRPSTFKRTAKTVVTIKDKNTIVIGGLIGDDVTNTEFKVPCLGNIPLLGWLFSYKSKLHEESNLFIFITPRIVENPVEAKDLYDTKQEHINKVEEGVIKRYQRKFDIN